MDNLQAGWWSPIVLLLLLPGCTTFRGAPKPPFDVARIEASQTFVDPSCTFEKLATAKSKEDRNALMSPILALIDIRYGQFRQNLASNKKHSSAITSTLLLAADIAGGLTTSAGVKDNYLAFSALLTGGELIYDKNYMYEQTVSALVAKMDANRSAKLLEIRKAMVERDPDQYPGQVAIADLIEYHYAGTLLGAIAAVQRDAGVEAQANTVKLHQLEDVTALEIADSRAATARLRAMVANLPAAQKPLLATYLAGTGMDVSKDATNDEMNSALSKLRSRQYRHNPEDLIKALEEAGITVP